MKRIPENLEHLEAAAQEAQKNLKKDIGQENYDDLQNALKVFTEKGIRASIFVDYKEHKSMMFSNNLMDMIAKENDYHASMIKQIEYSGKLVNRFLTIISALYQTTDMDEILSHIEILSSEYYKSIESGEEMNSIKKYKKENNL